MLAAPAVGVGRVKLDAPRSDLRGIPAEEYMRAILVTVVLVVLFPSLAVSAENPDGMPGTVWLDLGAAGVLDGQFRSETYWVETDPLIVHAGESTFAAQIGLVASNRLTFLVGATRKESRLNFDGSSEDRTRIYSVTFGARIYLRLPTWRDKTYSR